MSDLKCCYTIRSVPEAFTFHINDWILLSCIFSMINLADNAPGFVGAMEITFVVVSCDDPSGEFIKGDDVSVLNSNSIFWSFQLLQTHGTSSFLVATIPTCSGVWLR